MKVLHIISSGGMYGAEAVILNLLQTMRERREPAALAIFANSSDPNRQFYDTALRHGFSPFLISCRRQFDPAAITALRDLVQREDVDVLHAHGYKADIYSYLACARQRVVLVSTCHNWLKERLKLAAYGIADRLVLRRYNGVIAVSEAVRQKLLSAGVRPERIHLVRNGIDLQPFGRAPSLRSSSEGLVVGLIGRLSHEKGVDIFLLAAARLMNRIPNARFVVVGEGPDSAKLNQMLDELKIRGRAELLGRREDMPEVYRSLDIMVSASRQEGLPMAILEGMASRLPLVATTVGEVPTVVRDGVTGFVVAPEDVDALAAAVAKLLGDAALRERFGAAGRKVIEDEYSAARMTTEYLRIYEEALGATGARK